MTQDAGAQTLPLWATDISPGPGEAAQTVSILVTSNSNPGLFAAGPAVSPGGTLTYTPAPRRLGHRRGTIVAKDNGGTANGGADTSAPQTFTITVTPVTPASTSLPGVVTASTGWQLRDSLTTGAPTVTFTYGTRPPALVPLTGDWDGDGTTTPGVFQNGQFKLSNTNTTNPTPDVTFTFGDPRGYPVAGDFDGNGIDDIAVFQAGLWQIHYQGTGAPADTTITYGSGTWPATVPVAGDWDGDGIDGIGTWTAGTWNLRQTATPGAPELAFTYDPAPGAYPVVGDWNGDGTDTIGVKAGTTWQLNNANDTSTPDITLDYGATGDLPIIWKQPAPPTRT